MAKSKPFGPAAVLIGSSLLSLVAGLIWSTSAFASGTVLVGVCMFISALVGRNYAPAVLAPGLIALGTYVLTVANSPLGRAIGEVYILVAGACLILIGLSLYVNVILSRLASPDHQLSVH